MPTKSEIIERLLKANEWLIKEKHMGEHLPDESSALEIGYNLDEQAKFRELVFGGDR